jgi:hypothetical protein
MSATFIRKLLSAAQLGLFTLQYRVVIPVNPFQRWLKNTTENS